MDLVFAVYDLTSDFPNKEVFGITSQIQRAAVSIPSNIAEGSLRGSPKEFKQFLRTAFASGGELETQLIIAKRLYNDDHGKYGKVEALLSEVMRILNVLVSKSNF